MRMDYVTRAEFRKFAGQQGGGKYNEEQIDNAQEEVIERLEDWAHSAWPNVGVSIGTGSITQADKTLTLTSGVLTDNDIGREIRIAGAGVSGAIFTSVIASFTSVTEVELLDAAATSVTSKAVTWGDGDGTAAVVRSRTDYFDGGSKLISLTHGPVISVTSFLVNGETPGAQNYTLYPEVPSIVFNTPVQSLFGNRVISVAYSYGVTEAPRSVKRPVMMAMRTLMAAGPDSSRIPPNVSQYQTENTTFLMAQQKEYPDWPWPWDGEASQAIQMFWGPHRPTRFMSFV